MPGIKRSDGPSEGAWSSNAVRHDLWGVGAFKSFIALDYAYIVPTA